MIFAPICFLRANHRGDIAGFSNITQACCLETFQNRTQMPEKSGMDEALSSSLPAGPTAGATACPKAGVATAAASVNTKVKFRHCESIAFLLLSFRQAGTFASSYALYDCV
jgi:hypothetical protein